jgi:hypothetical protein
MELRTQDMHKAGTNEIGANIPMEVEWKVGVAVVEPGKERIPYHLIQLLGEQFIDCRSKVILVDATGKLWKGHVAQMDHHDHFVRVGDFRRRFIQAHKKPEGPISWANLLL